MRYFTALLITFIGFAASAAELLHNDLPIYKDSQVDIPARVTDLINRLSLEEKVQQLGGMAAHDEDNPFGSQDPNFGTAGNARLGIPPLIMGHGITGVRAGRNPQVKATYFSTPIAVGATWDPALYGRVGAALAKELRALGQNLNLGPTLNVIRHPLGGRNWESFSEDPYLISRLIVPFVKAQQQHGIIVGPKHFVVNNQESHRFDINNQVDERALREIYLRGFKASVVDGKALNIMCAYNRVNGVQACENKRLLTDILRDEWGFQGFVLSDFARAMHSTVPSALAGMNVEMHATKFYGKNLLAAVTQKGLDEAVIDTLLYQKLFAMFSVGMFDGKHSYPISIVHHDDHQNIALEVAQKSPILLKNNAQILPLDMNKYRSVAVIGPNAKPFPALGDLDYALYLQGGGSGRNWYRADAMISPLAAIKAVIPAEINVGYAAGVTTSNVKADVQALEQENTKLLREAVELASKSDLVILVVGLSGFDESEGRDRDHAGLPGEQEALIQAVLKTNANAIVINIAGAYVDIKQWVDAADTLLFVPYSGEKIGRAIAQVLVGEINPSGKLPFSYPKSVKQYPLGSFYDGDAFSKSQSSNTYSEGIYVGYRYFDQMQSALLFPFGYGLSYSKFKYTNLRVVPATEVPSSFVVRFDLENTSAIAGAEVVQLYINDPVPELDRPVKELKAFSRVYVDAHSKIEVELTLNNDAFAYYHPEKRQWTTETGQYKILVGSSSRDIKLERAVLIDNARCTHDCELP